jgi:hypothetical protein
LNRLMFYFGGPPPLGADSAGLCPEPQPQPLMTRVCRMLVGGRWVTVIDRKWLFGDAAKCKLCPRCTAVGAECMLMIAAKVDDRDAPLYRIDTDPERST